MYVDVKLCLLCECIYYYVIFGVCQWDMSNIGMLPLYKKRLGMISMVMVSDEVLSLYKERWGVMSCLCIHLAGTGAVSQIGSRLRRIAAGNSRKGRAYRQIARHKINKKSHKECLGMAK